MGNNNNKKEEIVKWLKEFNRLPSSRFVGLLGIDYEAVLKILEEMREEETIIKEEETTAVYWKLNNIAQ